MPAEERQLILLVPTADRAAANAALAAMSGHFDGWFSTPVITETDPDQFDADGRFSGTPRAWIGRAAVPVHVARKILAALVGIPSVQMLDRSRRAPATRSAELDRFLGDRGLRRPGRPIRRTIR